MFVQWNLISLFFYNFSFGAIGGSCLREYIKFWLHINIHGYLLLFG